MSDSNVNLTAPPAKQKIPAKGIVMLITFVGAGGFSGIFTKLALSDGISSSGAALLRMGTAAILMTLFVLLWPGKRKAIREFTGRPLMLALAAGVLLAIHFWTWFLAMERLPVFTCMLLFDLQPVFVVALSWLILKEKTPAKALIGIALCLIAAGIISFLGSDRSGGEATATGIVICLISSLVHSLYMLIGRAVLRETEKSNLDTAVYTWILYTACALVLAAIVLIRGDRLFGFGANTYIFSAHLVIINTFLGHTMMNAAMKYIPAPVVSLCTLAELGVSAATGYFILNEVPNVWVWVGCAVLVAGFIVFNRYNK